MDANMKAWIDGASYLELLSRWRFAPSGSPWFQGELGIYYQYKLEAKKAEVGQAEHVRTSKILG